jgi:hypothetical protein
MRRGGTVLIRRTAAPAESPGGALARAPIFTTDACSGYARRGIVARTDQGCGTAAHAPTLFGAPGGTREPRGRTKSRRRSTGCAARSYSRRSLRPVGRLHPADLRGALQSAAVAERHCGGRLLSLGSAHVAVRVRGGRGVDFWHLTYSSRRSAWARGSSRRFAVGAGLAGGAALAAWLLERNGFNASFARARDVPLFILCHPPRA